MDGKKEVALGLVQMSMGKDSGANLRKAVEMAGRAARKGAQVVCLPELFTAPYFAQDARARQEAAAYAEEIPGETTRALSEAARENGIFLIGGSIYEKAGGKLYNTSALFGPDGKMLGKYRKVHIPHDECFFEADYFEPGDLGFRVFDAGKLKVAPLICYDQWFPEAARSVALMGADAIFYPTAIATIKGVEQAEGSWQEAWENVMRGHAIANGISVAAVNRCGTEGKMDFWGGSFVCDAFGKTLARAGNREEVLVAKIDLAHSGMVRKGWKFMEKRRPDQYGIITKKEK
jgi:agmatine deiminase